MRRPRSWRKACAAGGSTSAISTTDSPIIAYDGEAAPPYDMATFSQSTVPGCRTPHVWLRDGRSLYDALGQDFTLLRFDPAIEVDGLVAAAARRETPMKILDVESGEAAALYRHKLLLSRPDRHVAWRGDRLPDDPLALIDLVRGALRPADSSAIAAFLDPHFGRHGFVPSAERPVEIGEIRESEIERN